MKRWVVVAPASLLSVLSTLAGSEAEARAALSEGRVFVGRFRQSLDDAQTALASGAEVFLAKARATSVLDLLHLDEALAVAHKPAGIPTIADHQGDAGSLQALVSERVGARVHPSSRLDVEVSGVVVFSRTEHAAQALLRARGEGVYVRRYLAMAMGDVSAVPKGVWGTWNAAIGRAKKPKLRAVDGAEATHALSKYRIIAESSGAVLLALAPQTGRTHQLRVHAAHAGLPLWGDRDYGGLTRMSLDNGHVLSLKRIALHCAWVRINMGPTKLRFDAPYPDELRKLWRQLGGTEEAIEAAITTDL
jgi:23S rRNA pseudouridine1911/1915/1917 synthase